MIQANSPSQISPSEQHLLFSSDSSYDSGLWMTAHTQLLEQRHNEISELSKDLTMLNEMYKDLNLRVESQQEDLNILEEVTIRTDNKIRNANKELGAAQSLRSSNFSLRILLLGTAATGIALGTGGIGLLIGLKPLSMILVSSGCTVIALGAVLGSS